MTCTAPRDAWRPEPGAENRRLVFSPLKGHADRHIKMPCGQCTSCRLDKARSWAVRAVHEASLHKANAFVTFTYSDEHLPLDFSVSTREMQLLNKRIRNEYGPFRFFGVAEYGERYHRPHYHQLLFGLDFPDKVPLGKSDSGEMLYYSERLSQIWGKGHVSIGAVTLQSAGYCARYSMKKVNGDRAADHYKRVHPITGEIVHVKPEFILMSRNPGLAAGWFDKFKSDVFPSNFVVIEGRKLPVPQYYLRRLEEEEQRLAAARRRVFGQAASKREEYLHERSGGGEARDLTRHTLADIRAKRLVRTFDPAEG